MLAPQIREAEERRLAGEAGRATSMLLEVLELAPWAPAALSVLARIHWEAGRLGPALVLLERIVAVDPANQEAVRDAARVALQRGDVFAALGHARASVRGDPLSADAHHLLGLALTGANRPVPGEHHYRRALELAGRREPAVLGNLAWNLKAQGRIAESRAVYAGLRADGAMPPGGLLGEARMEEAAGALDRAAAVLDEA
jgi:Flp pilus assembly protein TadD